MQPVQLNVGFTPIQHSSDTKKTSEYLREKAKLVEVFIIFPYIRDPTFDFLVGYLKTMINARDTLHLYKLQGKRCLMLPSHW